MDEIYDYLRRYVLIIVLVALVFLVACVFVGLKMSISSHKADELNRLLEQQQRDKQLIREIIESFAKVIDIKDSYTQGHSSRVAKYAKMLAEELGYDEDTVEKYYNIALMHDIGKIAIPDSVLNKPGKLTDEEYNIIKSHTERGYDVLKSISLMPEIVVGAEALARWFDSEGNLISPDVFMEILENAGRIYKLDKYMWEQAVKQLDSWKNTEKNKLTISVNISAKDFYSIDVYKVLTHLTKKYGVSHDRLRLEITESTLIENTVITDERLAPSFSKMSIWAYSIGTAIGWGSLVVTCNTYLAQAGIMGTVLGLILGMLVTFVITHNLQYMICKNQDVGGIYAFPQKACGYDFGFLAAWFLLLTYMSVL